MATRRGGPAFRIDHARSHGRAGHRTRTAAILCAFGSVLIGTTEAQAPQTAELTVRAAIVSAEFVVKPLPLLALEISNTRGRRDTVHTSLDGQFKTRLPVDRYRIRSLAPAVVGGHSYSWDLDANLESAAPKTVELTNANAAVFDVGQVAGPARVAAPAPARSRGELFDMVRDAVVRIESGLTAGSGFIVDEPAGAIVTNDHVLNGASEVTVYTDSVTRVRAVVVSHDRSADVAVLKIDPSAIAGRPHLALSGDGQSAAPLHAGDQVYAVGFPLNQERTFTSGILSSVRSGAIISDVNINHGNSGGPMINESGVVIGINTFMDVGRPNGPGLSGAITIAQALPVLRDAARLFAAAPLPKSDPLPVVPTARIPADALDQMVRAADPHVYASLVKNIDADRFWVEFQSPVSNAVFRKASDEFAAQDRRKREARAGASDEERYAGEQSTYEWEQYVGQELTPVVELIVSPKVGETTGSIFKRVLISPTLQATMRFKGDVRGVTIYRDGEAVVPIRAGHIPQRRVVNNQWVEMRDVANMGLAILDARVFKPRPDGTIPQITVAIDDLNRPNELSCYPLQAQIAARIWNDFAPLAGAIWPGEALGTATVARGDSKKIDKTKLPRSCTLLGGSWDY